MDGRADGWGSGWMGERCVTSKKRLLGRLPYFPTLIYFVSHKKLSVSKSNIMRLEFLKNTLLVLLMWTEHRQSLLSF